MLYDDEDYNGNIEKVRDRVFIIYPGGMPVKLPLLTYYRGDRFTLTLLGRNADNTPFDFSGAELTLQIKKDPDCEEFLGELSSFKNYLLSQSKYGRAYDIEQGNALDTTLDEISLFDPLGEFTNINEDIVFHDLQMNYFNTPITLVRGFFRIIKDVTRKPVFEEDPEPIILPKRFVKILDKPITCIGSLGYVVPPAKRLGLEKDFTMSGSVGNKSSKTVSLNKDFKISYDLTVRRITSFTFSLSKELEPIFTVTPTINGVSTTMVAIDGEVASSVVMGLERVPYDDEGEVIPPPTPKSYTVALFKEIDSSEALSGAKVKTISLSKDISISKNIDTIVASQFTIGLSKSVVTSNFIAMTIN